MTPPPEGTPGWAWLLAVVTVALITAITSWVTALPARRDAAASRQAAEVAAHEARPNSGGSMRDAINRIEARQVEQGKEIGEIKKDIGGLRADHRQEREDRANGDRNIWDTINRDAGSRPPWSPPIN
ncbi:hypothetical protein GCM10010401_14330 [Rarobacter faecitabidus]|uniref:Uncharacterized protein DUF2746 n=1 Tax=Rarobacter faecitabidus TaxID=13243 RepID=A0A542ZE31_RARFA|nr:DUF2746 domain-containing protein [Rarobacter faecitabidus]TQL58520.1 uncharacterized protein DUF2746 [Rarobacter faecitabidus]